LQFEEKEAGAVVWGREEGEVVEGGDGEEG